MRIADQLKLNSKLVNNQKAKATLRKTLSERRKKELAIEKQIAKKKNEKLKQLAELKKEKTLRAYFDRFFDAAWQGSNYVIALESDHETYHCLQEYGLELLSTEEYVTSLNDSLDKINLQIDSINSLLSNTKVLGNNSIAPFIPRDLLNKSYNFLKNISYLEKKIEVKKRGISDKVDLLKLKKASLQSQILSGENAYKKLVRQVKDLAEEYSAHGDRFKKIYWESMVAPKAETIYSMPELRSITLSERWENRQFQFLNAIRAFKALNLELPHPSTLGIPLSSITEIFSKPDVHFEEIDALGRYMAFFRVICGGAIQKSIAEAVKEPFSSELSYLEKSISEIDCAIELEIKNLKNLSKIQIDKKIAKINDKICSLKQDVFATNFNFKYVSNNFYHQFLFDLDNIKQSESKTAASFNLYVKEIQWILSRKGKLTVKKFFKTLEDASLQGLRTCTLTYRDSNNKLIFSKDGDLLFEFGISLESMLKMLGINGLSHSLKTVKSTPTLIVKWN